MKILLINSETFLKEMNVIKEQLEVHGHSTVSLFDAPEEVIEPDAQTLTDKEMRAGKVYKDADKREAGTSDKLKAFGAICDCDAVLALNFQKNQVPGYLGAGMIMELAMAYTQQKPIFVLNSLPSPESHRWVREVNQLQPHSLLGEIKNLPKNGQWAGLG
eukprot:gene26341-17438_t